MLANLEKMEEIVAGQATAIGKTPLDTGYAILRDAEYVAVHRTNTGAASISNHYCLWVKP